MESNNIDVKKRDRIRFLKNVLMTLGAGLLSALAMHVFIYPASFVPLGLEAVVTMLQEITSINAGIINIALNAPLLIYAFFKVDKKYVFYTILFTLVSSFALILLAEVKFPQYHCGNEGRILPAIFAGIMLGFRTGIMLRLGGSTGGVDVIAKMLQQKHPNMNIERLISILCVIPIGISYFVYNDFNCILLGVVQMFIAEKATTPLLKSSRNAVEVKIITKHPELIRDDIVFNLRHSATVTECKGMFSENEYYTVVSVINLYQMNDFITIIKKYPDTFVYYSEVQGVCGNFRRYKDEEAK